MNKSNFHFDLALICHSTEGIYKSSKFKNYFHKNIFKELKFVKFVQIMHKRNILYIFI